MPASGTPRKEILPGKPIRAFWGLGVFWVFLPCSFSSKLAVQSLQWKGRKSPFHGNIFRSCPSKRWRQRGPGSQQTSPGTQTQTELWLSQSITLGKNLPGSSINSPGTDPVVPFTFSIWRLNTRTPKFDKIETKTAGGYPGKRGRAVRGASRSSFPLCLHKSTLPLSNSTQRESLRSLKLLLQPLQSTSPKGK